MQDALVAKKLGKNYLEFGAGILAHVAGPSCVAVTYGQDGASKRLWTLTSTASVSSGHVSFAGRRVYFKVNAFTHRMTSLFGGVLVI